MGSRNNGIKLSLLFSLVISSYAVAQPLPAQITTPDQVETRYGTLRLIDGVPDAATADKVYEQLDFSRGVDSFLNSMQAVSMYAIRQSFRKAGIKDNDDVLIFSELMDAKSIFLTANADTVYFWPFLDLSKGPIVVEVPSNVLGVLDDMWFRWISDVGVPGPDRGQGGKYLILPPGYAGALPEGGYFIVRSRTMGVTLLGRAFLENNDPKPAVERIKNELKIYPYSPGGVGTSIGSFLLGDAKLGQIDKPRSPNFVEGSGKVINTVFPNDFSFYEMLNSVVQEEPAEALDAELAGQFAAIGIVKGQPFNPDARMKKLLTDAIAFANVAARAVSIRTRPSEGFGYYDNERPGWSNPLFVGGYEFMNPPPFVTKDGVKQPQNRGARLLDARLSMFYLATGITPAMVMRLTNIGSQYLGNFFDAKAKPLDGSKTYKVVLPSHIPAGKFWSLTVYDNQTRSMLDTPQRYPRAGSQSYPTPAATPEPDGSTTVYFGPSQPKAAKEGNWIQTLPGKGWFVLLRLYNPLEPFFDKSWRVGNIEEVTP